jgi:hypothetical protein
LLFLLGLSPVRDQAIVASLDGDRLSSEGGLPALHEVEHRLGLADRFATCLEDPRAPERIVHRSAAIIRSRLLMIAAGYADGNDADTLRHDPMFELALDRRPGEPALCMYRFGRKRQLRARITSPFHRRGPSDMPANRPTKNRNALPRLSARLSTLAMFGPQIATATQAIRQITVTNVIT